MFERRRFRVQGAGATGVVLGLGLLFGPLPAHAEVTSAIAAGELAEAGRALMAVKQYSAACSKLEASDRLAPSPTTQFQLATCYERLGKTASAWKQYRQLMSASPDALEQTARERARRRIDQLEPRLSYLVIDAWRGQSVSVRRDGVALDEAVLGTPVPLDPGPHAIVASAPGKRSWSTRVQLGAVADQVHVTIPILQDQALEASTQSSTNLTPTVVHASGTTGSFQRTLAVAVAALGVGGIATGAVFGVKAAANWSEAKASCNPYPYCGDAGPRLASDAAHSGTISTLAFVAGGLGVATGALLWFTAPAPDSETHTVWQLDPFAVRLRGRF